MDIEPLSLPNSALAHVLDEFEKGRLCQARVLLSNERTLNRWERELRHLILSRETVSGHWVETDRALVVVARISLTTTLAAFTFFSLYSGQPSSLESQCTLSGEGSGTGLSHEEKAYALRSTDGRLQDALKAV